MRALCLLSIILFACSSDNKEDAGTNDSGKTLDASPTDAQPAEAGTQDGSTQDGSTPDSGTPDTGVTTAECEDYQNQHPAWLWCDGFEDEQDITVNYNDTSDRGFAVTTEDPFRGSYSLRQHYTQGQVDAGWISWFYADALGNNYGPIYDEIYVRWYHKFEAGFEGMPPKMARVRSLGPGWDKRFSVLHWIDSGSSNREIVADVHVPHSTQANSSGWLPVARSDFYYTDPSNIGRWICHEMYVEMNSSGAQDGSYRFWADDRLIIERTDVDLRGSTSYNFNEIMLDTYWNGGSPKAQDRYYDNLVVSTERIGCL